MSNKDNVLKKGSWIVSDDGFSKWTGFIVSISYALEEYTVNFVRKVRNGSGKTFFVNDTMLVDFEDAELLEKETMDGCVRQLIDMALDKNDKEWFLQLHSMLPESKEVSL